MRGRSGAGDGLAIGGVGKQGLTRQGVRLAGQRNSLGAQGARSRTHGPLIVIGSPVWSLPVNLVCV